MKEKVEVQRQAEKENADLLKQVKLLEAELEEQVNRVIELEHAQRTESGDLQQQVQALEKQLEKNRRFLDVSDEENYLWCCLACCIDSVNILSHFFRPESQKNRCVYSS